MVAEVAVAEAAAVVAAVPAEVAVGLVAAVVPAEVRVIAVHR